MPGEYIKKMLFSDTESLDTTRKKAHGFISYEGYLDWIKTDWITPFPQNSTSPVLLTFTSYLLTRE